MDYNAKIDYIKGKENHIADFLSRIQENEYPEDKINAHEELEDNNSTSSILVETINSQ